MKAPRVSKKFLHTIIWLLSSGLLYLGLILLQSNISLVSNVYSSQFWDKTTAKVISYDLLVKKTTTKSLTTKIVALYEYSINGRTYRSDVVSWLNTYSTSNPKQKSHHLEMLKSGEVTIFVNPLMPSQSVLDNSAPVEYLAANALFIVFPCFFGFTVFAGFFVQKTRKFFGFDSNIAVIVEKLVVFLTYLFLGALPLTCLIAFTDELTLSTTLIFSGILMVLAIFYVKSTRLLAYPANSLNQGQSINSRTTQD